MRVSGAVVVFFFLFVCFFRHARVCVFQRGVGRPLVVRSLIASTAAGSGNGTLLFSGYSRRESSARSDLSLRWVMGVTGSVLLPWCVFFFYLLYFFLFTLPKTTVEQSKLRLKSNWSAHVRTCWREAGPVFFRTQHQHLKCHTFQSEKCHSWVFQRVDPSSQTPPFYFLWPSALHTVNTVPGPVQMSALSREE